MAYGRRFVFIGPSGLVGVDLQFNLSRVTRELKFEERAHPSGTEGEQWWSDVRDRRDHPG